MGKKFAWVYHSRQCWGRDLALDLSDLPLDPQEAQPSQLLPHGATPFTNIPEVASRWNSAAGRVHRCGQQRASPMSQGSPLSHSLSPWPDIPTLQPSSPQSSWDISPGQDGHLPSACLSQGPGAWITFFSSSHSRTRQ